VGQKIHPTGFRIGINKSHTSSWFANFTVFSKVLKKDHQIQQLLKKEFNTIYDIAGISKLEIKRTINQLELLIYAARPKILTRTLEKKNKLFNLKQLLKTFFKDSKKIRIKVLQLSTSENESLLVARSLASQLEKRIAFRKAIRQTTQLLQAKKGKGFKIQVSGRLNGAEIARVEWVRKGRVPLQSLGADIQYAMAQAHTIFGVLGIKVWIFHK